METRFVARAELAREPLSPPRPVPATPGCRTDAGRQADRRRADEIAQPEVVLAGACFRPHALRSVMRHRRRWPVP